MYLDGDEVSQIFFLKKGHVGFVLPQHRNLEYINVNEGAYFGDIDIVGSLLTQTEALENFSIVFEKWY